MSRVWSLGFGVSGLPLHPRLQEASPFDASRSQRAASEHPDHRARVGMGTGPNAEEHARLLHQLWPCKVSARVRERSGGGGHTRPQQVAVS